MNRTPDLLITNNADKVFESVDWCRDNQYKSTVYRVFAVEFIMPSVDWNMPKLGRFGGIAQVWRKGADDGKTKKRR